MIQLDRNALRSITYGLYVITAKAGSHQNGQIANTVFQVSSEPPIIAVGINRQNYSYGLIRESKNFVISVLSKEAPLSLVGLFGFKSGRDVDKLGQVKYQVTSKGVPYLIENSLAYFELEVLKEIEVSTHNIFVGRLTDAVVLEKGEPMTYAYYQELKNGTTPKTAPTFVKEIEEKKAATDRYRCTICNYIYNPAEGDMENNIKPGTLFDQLPDDWVCPICGAGKDAFEKI